MNVPKTEIKEKIKQMYPGISDKEVEKMQKNEELMKVILADPFFDENIEEEGNIIDSFETEKKEDNFYEDISTIKDKILNVKNLLEELQIQEISHGYQKEYKIYNSEWDYVGYVNLKLSWEHMEISDFWTSNLRWWTEDVNAKLKEEVRKMADYEEKWLGTAILLYLFTEIAKKYNIKTFHIISAKQADKFYEKTLKRFEKIWLIVLNNEGGENSFSWEIFDEIDL